MRRTLIFTLYILTLAWLLLCVLCINTPSGKFWPAGFIAMTMPAPLLLNLGFLFYWLFGKSVRVLLPVAVLFLAWGFYKRGFALNLLPGKAPADAKTLTVLSFNVRIFNLYEHLRPDNRFDLSENSIDWVKNFPADVFCLQEFYTEPGNKIYDSVGKIWKGNGKYAFVSKSLVNGIGGQFGLAIFSKYPIVNKGSIQFGKLTQNHGMFADIKMGEDTVRVYNFHLQSMSIEEKEIVDSYSSESQVKLMRVKQLARRLKKGFMKRSAQVDTLVSHFQKSPYPVVIACDLNDTPYSYSYDKLDGLLRNAFTEAGNGFGATYNGRLPFLRIDNQFYSDHFRIVDFKVHTEVPYSDHFPLSATYVFRRK
ncbi:endonuclease/exonuclease/phosphatase family protein [Adhaeribacter soli]|uniref:Endonuclease/exonuclease/phosphatase family protein n=1 Tax=Adhaeribacter soli TaxID=2607655 RepID=A0A5N1J847_9BACT|nr:endonuclease/exonuclease/phosphatase family protein [Adhaeribacter soli]KAA9340980.1 endonuclease/exonuclease/phosphatase family protein [Adhaeribacter soli]